MVERWADTAHQKSRYHFGAPVDVELFVHPLKRLFDGLARYLQREGNPYVVGTLHDQRSDLLLARSQLIARRDVAAVMRKSRQGDRQMARSTVAQRRSQPSKGWPAARRQTARRPTTLPIPIEGSGEIMENPSRPRETFGDGRARRGLRWRELAAVNRNLAIEDGSQNGIFAAPIDIA